MESRTNIPKAVSFLLTFSTGWCRNLRKHIWYKRIQIL